MPDGPAATTARTCSGSAGAAPRRNHTKNSTFPLGPGSGLAATPATPRPRPAATAATSSTASARNAGSRTTPPAPTRSLPTSNCGLTISARSPSGAVQAASAGSTSRSEMKDRSATVSATAPPMASGVRVRTLVRSSTRHPVVGAQRPGELPVAHVDGDDLDGPGAQQHVGETAGGRAGVQAAPPDDGQPVRRERGQRTGQLVTAARHVLGGRVLPGDQHRVRRVDHRGDLAGDRAPDLDPAVLDQLGGLFAGTGQLTTDELGVETGAAGHGGATSPVQKVDNTRRYGVRSGRCSRASPAAPGALPRTRRSALRGRAGRHWPAPAAPRRRPGDRCRRPAHRRARRPPSGTGTVAAAGSGTGSVAIPTAGAGPGTGGAGIGGAGAGGAGTVGPGRGGPGTGPGRGGPGIGGRGAVTVVPPGWPSWRLSSSRAPWQGPARPPPWPPEPSSGWTRPLQSCRHRLGRRLIGRRNRRGRGLRGRGLRGRGLHGRGLRGRRLRRRGLRGRGLRGRGLRGRGLRGRGLRGRGLRGRGLRRRRLRRRGLRRRRLRGRRLRRRTDFAGVLGAVAVLAAFLARGGRARIRWLRPASRWGWTRPIRPLPSSRRPSSPPPSWRSRRPPATARVGPAVPPSPLTSRQPRRR